MSPREELSKSISVGHTLLAMVLAVGTIVATISAWYGGVSERLRVLESQGAIVRENRELIIELRGEVRQALRQSEGAR